MALKSLMTKNYQNRDKNTYLITKLISRNELSLTNFHPTIDSPIWFPLPSWDMRPIGKRKIVFIIFKPHILSQMPSKSTKKLTTKFYSNLLINSTMALPLLPHET